MCPNIVPGFCVTIAWCKRGRERVGRILSYLVSHLQGDPASHQSSVQCGQTDWATPSVSPHRVKMFALAWLNSTFAYQTINILAVALHCYQGGPGTCTLCRSGASVNTFYAACNHSLVCQYNSFSDVLSQSVKRSLFLDIQYEKFFTLLLGGNNQSGGPASEIPHYSWKLDVTQIILMQPGAAWSRLGFLFPFSLEKDMWWFEWTIPNFPPLLPIKFFQFSLLCQPRSHFLFSSEYFPFNQSLSAAGTL